MMRKETHLNSGFGHPRKADEDFFPHVQVTADSGNTRQQRSKNHTRYDDPASYQHQVWSQLCNLQIDKTIVEKQLFCYTYYTRTDKSVPYFLGSNVKFQQMSNSGRTGAAWVGYDLRSYLKSQNFLRHNFYPLRSFPGFEKL